MNLKGAVHTKVVSVSTLVARTLSILYEVRQYQAHTYITLVGLKVILTLYQCYTSFNIKHLLIS
jgi:hypothetical protein